MRINVIMTIKRTFLNIGLLLLFVTAIDAGYMFMGLSARYSGPPSFVDGSLSEVLILLVLSSVIIVIFSGGFKGYKDEFLKPYKNSVIATVAVQIVTTIFSFGYLIHANTTERRGDIMPGLSILGEYFFAWLVWGIIVFALAVMWVITAIRHRKKDVN